MRNKKLIPFKVIEKAIAGEPDDTTQGALGIWLVIHWHQMLM